MDDMSFDNYKKSIEKAISMPNQAFFGANRQVQEEQESACKVHTYLKSEAKKQDTLKNWLWIKNPQFLSNPQWNLVKMITAWGDNLHQVSWG